MPDKHAIASRAHAIYEARGKTDGHDNVSPRSGGRREHADEAMPEQL